MPSPRTGQPDEEKAIRKLSKRDVDRTLRTVLILVYAVLLIAGLLAWFVQPPALVDGIGIGRSKVWALYVILGGIVSLAGVSVPRGALGDWFGEWVGIPLLASAVALYGAVALSTVDDEPGRAPGALIFMGMALLMVVRWFRVRDDARRAVRPPTPPPPG